MQLMKSVAFLFSALAFSLAAVACGQSPLLNHTTATPLATPPSDPGTTPGQPPAPRGEDATSSGQPAGACPLSFPQSGLCASLSWDSTPSDQQQNAFTLRFWNRSSGSAAGPYQDAEGEVGVQLWMPAMGHGSSPVEIAHAGVGIYSVSRVFFVMPGAWDIRIQLKKGHQVLEQAVFGLNL